MEPYEVLFTQNYRGNRAPTLTPHSAGSRSGKKDEALGRFENFDHEWMIAHWARLGKREKLIAGMRNEGLIGRRQMGKMGCV